MAPRIGSKLGPRAEDLSGRRFGRWTVLERAHVGTNGRVYWHCRCDCGAERATAGVYLRAGESESCGCLLLEKFHAANFKHGQSESVNQKATPEYVAWSAMIHRCERPSYRGFDRYGGRGISVCARWRHGEGERSGFECFLADMGARPSKDHSLDRYPNNDGNYEPTNCRWATRSQQAQNRKNPWIKRRENAK